MSTLTRRRGGGRGARVHRSAAVGLALAVGFCLAGCSGHSKHPPTTPTASTTATADGFAKIQSQLLGSAASSTAGPTIAPQTANVHLLGATGSTVSLTAQIVSVTVSGATTELHWRLASANGTPVSALGNWASGGTSSNTDTSQVAIVDVTGKQRLLPYFNPAQAVFAEGDCLCSDTPRQVSSTPVDMYATYPAVSSATTSVTVAIPGFPAMTDVPVTRS